MLNFIVVLGEEAKVLVPRAAVEPPKETEEPRVDTPSAASS